MTLKQIETEEVLLNAEALALIERDAFHHFTARANKGDPELAQKILNSKISD